ncbi:hypothetical protein YQE_06422, partial [Dendroctonus ponderosae]
MLAGFIQGYRRGCASGVSAQQHENQGYSDPADAEQPDGNAARYRAGAQPEHGRLYVTDPLYHATEIGGTDRVTGVTADIAAGPKVAIGKTGGVAAIGVEAETEAEIRMGGGQIG